jgi:hypothetical protein
VLQIRRAVYGGPYIDLLDELARKKNVQKLFGIKPDKPDVGETSQERILRFFALWRHGANAFKGAASHGGGFGATQPVLASCPARQHLS